MARKLRLEYAGACYHVINRGNCRSDVFGSAGAADAFEICLGEAAERYGWRGVCPRANRPALANTSSVTGSSATTLLRNIKWRCQESRHDPV